jgi:uncharacterized protein (DUF58 family)
VSRFRERAGAGSAGAQFLNPDVLSKIANLEILARTVVDGFLNGPHRSPFLGLSLDFAEHRPYMPGDDIRRIDWRLYARTDRHYIKLYEAETNSNFSMLVDVSRSMSYGSHDVTKLEYAKYLSACLVYFSRQQRDRVGLITFDHDIVEYVPPSSRNLNLCLHTLHRANPGRPGELERPLRKATETLRRKGIVALVSDLYETPENVISSVRMLAGRGHDVVVFHVLDPAEIDFPVEDASSFEDLETGEQIPVVPAKLRDEYRDLVRVHMESLETSLTGSRIDYVPLDTSKPLDHALFRYLLIREKRGKVR